MIWALVSCDMQEVPDSVQNDTFLRDYLFHDQSQHSTLAIRFSFLYFKRMNLQMLPSGYFAGNYFCTNKTLNSYLLITYSFPLNYISFSVVREATEEWQSFCRWQSCHLLKLINKLFKTMWHLLCLHLEFKGEDDDNYWNQHMFCGNPLI